MVGLLQEWERDRRLLVDQQSQEERVLRALVMEKPTMLTAGAPTTLRPAASLLVAPQMVGDTPVQMMLLRHPVKDRLDRVVQEVRQRLGPVLAEEVERVVRAEFEDVVLEPLVFAVGTKDEQEAAARVRESAERFFEGTWIHRPLHALNRIPPVDAAGHPVLRRKLRGVVQFLEECAAHGRLGGYDFDRLRRKLGLTAAGVAAGGAATDIGAMGAAELAGLPAETLSADQLQQAFQAAVRLDAQELGVKFAQALVGRPADAGPADRGRWYFYLADRAVAEGNTDLALDHVNEGERVDCERNEGRRRNEFELRRGQVHVKRREADQAHDVFDRLLERDPANAKTRGAAVEGMLSLRQGARALRFAEGGLAAARQENDRDSEQYFLELAEAARKQGG
jgi:tetratricopeptide (TPR) repeat protein